ncbi:MAG TPA: PadR family transcriptional regulator [Ignavibacteriaceae bacterium]|nr:PadR family transcriptional regulator [Ignavibacteriaceae bacterium]
MEIDITNLETEMNRGFLQILVLAALEQKMYGYQMLKELEELGYRVEENTLYPILRRQEKNGLIKSEWDVTGDRPKKFYIITPQGRSVRKKALSIWNEQNEILKKLMEI